MGKEERTEGDESTEANDSTKANLPHAEVHSIETDLEMVKINTDYYGMLAMRIFLDNSARKKQFSLDDIVQDLELLNIEKYNALKAWAYQNFFGYDRRTKYKMSVPRGTVC